LEGERPAGSRAARAAAGVLALLLIALAGGCGEQGRGVTKAFNAVVNG
jgi:hypothetical protein